MMDVGRVTGCSHHEMEKGTGTHNIHGLGESQLASEDFIRCGKRENSEFSVWVAALLDKLGYGFCCCFLSFKVN